MEEHSLQKNNYLHKLSADLKNLLILLKKSRSNRIIFLLYLLSFLFFWINSQYVSYPDENVNLLGAKSILQGGVAYRDFFDHHMPLAWYLGSVLLLLSHGVFTTFRTLWSLFVFISFSLLSIYICKKYKEFFLSFLFFMVLYPLAGVYFWFHLFLADSLAGFFFSMVFWLIGVQLLSKRIDYKGIVAASLLTFALIFSSLTYIYLAFALYLAQVYLLFINKKGYVKFLLISIAPYILYLIYLLLSGTFSDFYFANITYNTQIYIDTPNYVRGAHFNPLKFALTLIYNFYSSYVPLLINIKDLDVNQAINSLLGLGTLLLLIFAFLRSSVLGVIFLLILSFSSPRSTIEFYKETNYQMSVFFLLGLISAIFSVFIFEKKIFVEKTFKDFSRLAFLLLLIFFFFASLGLLKNTYDKYYLRYTQKLPSIANVAYSASFVDQVLKKGDYYWMGPYDPDQEFFVQNARLPGKYPTLLAGFDKSKEVQQSFLSQFTTHPPKLIIYRHAASMFDTPALVFGKFFVDWMNGRYTSVEHIQGVKTINSPSTFTLSTDLYIRNQDIKEMIQVLKNDGYIVEVPIEKQVKISKPTSKLAK